MSTQNWPKFACFECIYKHFPKPCMGTYRKPQDPPGMYSFSMIFASGSGKAKASREDDKRKILHFIAGTPEEEQPQPSNPRNPHGGREIPSKCDSLDLEKSEPTSLVSDFLLLDFQCVYLEKTLGKCDGSHGVIAVSKIWTSATPPSRAAALIRSGPRVLHLSAKRLLRCNLVLLLLLLLLLWSWYCIYYFPQEPPFNPLCCELSARNWIMIGNKHWLPAASGDFSSKPFSNSYKFLHFPLDSESHRGTAECGARLLRGPFTRRPCLTSCRILGPTETNRGAPIIFQYWSVLRFLDFHGISNRKNCS